MLVRKFKHLFVVIFLFCAACQFVTPSAERHPVSIISANAAEKEEVVPPRVTDVSYMVKKGSNPSYFRNKSKSDIRIGILAPFTGDHDKLGTSIKNTALMALYEMSSEKVILQFYDTMGTAEGAVAAAVDAINQGADLIIGPVFSHEVRAISGITTSAGIDVLTFTSDPTVLEYGVYTLALLLPQQVDRIISYACSQGKNSFAILAQDSPSGHMVTKAAITAAYRCDAQVSKIAYYSPDQGNMVTVIKEIVGDRAKYVDAFRRQSKKEGEYAEGYVKPEPEEGQEEEKDILEQYASSEEIPLEFDAILIADEGSTLRSLAATLSYYDISNKEVQFLGTQLWSDSSLNKERVLIGSWYTAIPNEGFKDFSRRYRNIYKSNPPRIVSQVYDAISLAIILANKGNFSSAAIIDPSGYMGVDGIFRIFTNGMSERGMAIMHLEKNKSVVIDAAPVTFSSIPLQEEELFPEDETKDQKNFTIKVYTEEVTVPKDETEVLTTEEGVIED